ncbi:hypothetical protein I7I53_07951 [Histoplasma capsulatum var. duboisii H88]|uniref:Uncharacterized protein n=1 Tax=Ajellomyces capsulatus (strain H88) TaxID=544711 RepID=A0A8A1LER3_AJEC8|nr:hypothetical protein I7I53_07951 [Histoplasma capsulatum var. duboisii H88]
MKHTVDRFEPSLSRSFSVIFSVKNFFFFFIAFASDSRNF